MTTKSRYKKPGWVQSDNIVSDSSDLTDNNHTSNQIKKPIWVPRDNSNLSYLALQKGSDTNVIVFDDNKYTSNNCYISGGKVHFYWRCNQYRKKCASRFTTLYDKNQYDETQKFGHIIPSSIQNDHNHVKNWQRNDAIKQWLIDRIKLDVSSGKLPKDAYDDMNLRYPNECLLIPNFTNISHQIYYHRKPDRPPLPKTWDDIMFILNKTKYGMTYFSRQQHEANDTLQTHNTRTIFNQNIYHQEQALNTNNMLESQLQRDRLQIDIKKNQISSQVCATNLPESFYGSMFIGATANRSIVLGTKHGQEIVSKSNRLNVDGTFPSILVNYLTTEFNKKCKPWGSVLFHAAHFEAPTVNRNSLSLITSATLMVNRTKEEYKQVSELYVRSAKSNGFKFS